MEEKNLNYYIQLLEANKNLILTGAPGTGKTYLAKAIADAMGAEYEFVQFHPSYGLHRLCGRFAPYSSR